MRPLALALLVFVLACSDDGPEFVGGDPDLFFSGTIIAEDNTESHGFDLTSSGTIQVQLEALSAVAGETGEPLEIASITVGLGRPNVDTCIASRSTSLAPGESFIVFLSPASFCVSVTRPLLVPVDAQIEYTVSVSPALS